MLLRFEYKGRCWNAPPIARLVSPASYTFSFPSYRDHPLPYSKRPCLQRPLGTMATATPQVPILRSTMIQLPHLADYCPLKPLGRTMTILSTQQMVGQGFG
jgi:hypothetical protein